MERRLAAILAADVVGYSRLMEADEEATLSTLNTYRRTIDGLIEDHRGRVFGTAGDSVVAEFASPVEAVRCAVEVQKVIEEHNSELAEVRRMRFRIGVNLGDVMVEGDDLLGDGVNVAARLEGLADPGGVCISGPVLDQVEGKLNYEFEDLGVQEVKNIARPVRVYCVRSAVEPSIIDDEFATVRQKQSIAVLPFDNISGDAEQDYFSDGITEDLITDLSKISALFVVARNSSFSYKGEAVKIQHVAHDLGVRHVVEGSVRKAGNRVRITAQLIDALTGGHVWADRFDRELDDIFAVQDEITQKIVDALQLVLLPGEAESLGRAPTSNFRAYDFYLKGRQSFHSVAKAKYIEARHLFERAIECDPDFARAYCGLADCGSQLFFLEGDSKNLEGAIEAVTKALALEPDLAEAHASLGFALSLTGDRRKAEQEFATAVELDPNLYEAHYYWARVCFEQGNLLEAATHFEQAWRVSPRDPQTPSLLLGIYRDLNRDEDVKTVARKTLEIGMRKLEVEPDNTRACLSCAFALVHLNRYSDVMEMIDRAIRNDPSDRVNYYNIACLYAIMGQTDKALDILEESTLGGGGLMDWAKNDGDFDSLRDHPRFKALMEQ